MEYTLIENQSEFNSLFSGKISDKVIELKQETYVVEEPIHLGSNVVLEGNSSTLIFKPKDNALSEFISIKGSTEIPEKNVVLSSLNLLGREEEFTGLKAINVASIHLENISFSGFKASTVRLENVKEGQINSSSFRNTEIGIFLDSSEGLHINGSTFSEIKSLSSIGIDVVLNESKGIHLKGNTFSKSLIGVKVLNSNEVIIYGNTFHELNEGITLDTSDSSVVHGNTFKEVVNGAISCSSSVNFASLTGNTMEECGEGITASELVSSVITANTITTSTTNGINLKSNTRNNLLYSNVLSENEGTDFVNSGTVNQTDTKYNHFLGKEGS